MRASQIKQKDTPGAADKPVQVILALYIRVVRQTPPSASSNPDAKIENLHKSAEGLHTCTTEEMDAYRAYHPLGRTARLAMKIMINVGPRVSDATILGPSNIYRDQNRMA